MRGGLIGVNEGGSVSYSYYNTNTSGQFDTEKGEPKTTTEMKQQATYEGWDFESVWNIDPNINNGYPYLRIFAPVIPKLPKMQPPVWQEYIATWETVENAENYKIRLYKKNESEEFEVVNTIEATANNYDYVPMLTELGEGEYALTVQAIGDGENYIDGEESDMSTPIQVIKLNFESPPPQILKPFSARSANPMITIQAPTLQLQEGQLPWLLHFKIAAYADEEKTTEISSIDTTENPEKFEYSTDNGLQWKDFPSIGLGLDMYGALVRGKLNVGPRQQAYITASVGTKS